MIVKEFEKISSNQNHSPHNNNPNCCESIPNGHKVEGTAMAYSVETIKNIVSEMDPA